ncbi:hypothetical protein O0L34_g5908 [Tuta absoluta]|nr:hypothetical protein O0L34_g5908 [Tuta absoluta]
MFEVICVATLLALARCNPAEPINYDGEWTAIKVYPKIANEGNCDTMSLELTTDKCDFENAKIPVYKINYVIDSPESAIKVPVIPDPKNLAAVFEKKCSCHNEEIADAKFLVFRNLNEKYFLLYTSLAGTDMVVLVAKEVPSTAELEDFEESNPVLYGEEGSVLCTNDMKPLIGSISNKDFSSHWLNYRPSANRQNGTTIEPSN